MENKKGKKLFIIHFQPLELFPPAMNVIDYLGRNYDGKIIVVTNKKSKANTLQQYKSPYSNIKIFRPSGQSKSSIKRYVNYVSFYLSASILLIRYNPNIVFYFETISSWPALIYKKLRQQRVKLMVHYHEYTELERYAKGMFLNNYMHGLESKMYKRFYWISHTNPVRMEMFKNEHHLQSTPSSVFHVMPNYPSKTWAAELKKDIGTNELKKMVFVGSLGYDNMYLQEVMNWLSFHQEKFSLDVYSYNIDEKAKMALRNYKHKNIQFLGGCDYQSLPVILKDYDIGLVIYKPFSKNTIHAVSNKVFEYLACGLDVWFSEDMTYTFEYKRENVYPKILPVNFKELSSLDYKAALSRNHISYKASHFYCENIYPEILDEIISMEAEAK